MASTYDGSKEFKGDDMKVEVATEERASLEASGAWFMEEKRLIRKLDRRILPIACLLYLFAYLDRSNLGNARVLTGTNDGKPPLPTDALGGDPTGILFDWVNSAFFFSYILCQVPATILSKLVAPRIWLALAAIGWGTCSTLMSTGFDFGGLMTTRVFLGIFEAGFGPAIPLYFSHISMAFRDWRIYTGGVIYFALNCSLASTSAFLPTILKTLGFSSARVQLMTVPPYAVAAFVIVLGSWISDRLQSRALASLVGGVGYLILLFVPTNLHARYFATFCITSGTYTSIGIIIAWFAHNLGSETKKATGIPMFMAIGQCGSILGSHLFPTTEGPRYIKGFAVCCGLEIFGALCALVMTISYRLDNARRNKLHGVPKEDARVDVAEMADKAPTFRYII
ncbi:hypothetical protein HHX47_DHR2000927 [Lentinula edodes]|nr:hypothetical protein HHX47_DHR2000927 [Lentinula edodes]